MQVTTTLMMCDRKDLREETVSRLTVCRLEKTPASFFSPLSAIFASSFATVLQCVHAGAAERQGCCCEPPANPLRRSRLHPCSNCDSPLTPDLECGGVGGCLPPPPFFHFPRHCLTGGRLGSAARPHPRKLGGSCGGAPRRTVMRKRKCETPTVCNYRCRAAAARLGERERDGSSAGAEGRSVTASSLGLQAIHICSN